LVFGPPFGRAAEVEVARFQCREAIRDRNLTKTVPVCKEDVSEVLPCVRRARIRDLIYDFLGRVAASEFARLTDDPEFVLLEIE
jgi:hypothetical protein